MDRAADGSGDDVWRARQRLVGRLDKLEYDSADARPHPRLARDKVPQWVPSEAHFWSSTSSTVSSQGIRHGQMAQPGEEHRARLAPIAHPNRCVTAGEMSAAFASPAMKCGRLARFGAVSPDDAAKLSRLLRDSRLIKSPRVIAP